MTIQSSKFMTEKQEKPKLQPIELECEKDPKDPKHLVCEEKDSSPVPFENREEKRLKPLEERGLTETGDPKRVLVSEEGEGSNIIIGAINIGARPVKEFFRSRHERFYHPSKPGGRLHFAVDLFLIGAVLALIVLSLLFFFKGRSSVSPEPEIDFKMSLSSMETALGGTVLLNFSYFNGEEEELKDARIVLKSLDGMDVISVKGGDWDGTTSTISLGDAPALSSGRIEVQLKSVKAGKSEISAVFAYLDKNNNLYGEMHQVFVDTLLPEVKLNSFVRYYSAEGEQLGRGPLPPKVGSTTKYQAVWLAEKAITSLDEVIVSGKLGENVKWTGFAPLGGDISFNQLTREVVWKAGRVSGSLEANQETKGVVFEIAFTPDISQAGKEAILIRNIKIQGKDSATGTILRSEAPDITTNLIFDTKAQGKGIVE